MIRRRELLAAGIAAAAPPEAGILDAHTHFYDPNRPQGVPWPPKSDPLLYRTVLPAEFRRLTAPLGVTGTIAVEASPWVEDNQWLLDLAGREPLIAGVTGNLDPLSPDFPGLLERFAANPLFKGIRLNQTKLAAAGGAELRRLANAGLQLDVLGSPAMLGYVVRLSDAVPELRIILDHLPFDAPREQPARGEYESALNELRSRKPVFAKVSGVLRRVNGSVPADPAVYRPALDELWDVFGPDRLIYASNWPVSERLAPYRQVLAVVRAYFDAKGETAAGKYFRLNSIAAYRWSHRRR